MENFLWHHVSEQETEQIKKEAKKIMDSFANIVAPIEKEAEEIPFVERDEQTRDEIKEKIAQDKEFKEIFFENAPEKEQDYIKAERRKWKE